MLHVCTATCISPPCISKSNISSKRSVRQGRFGKVGSTRLLSRHVVFLSQCRAQDHSCRDAVARSCLRLAGRPGTAGRVRPTRAATARPREMLCPRPAYRQLVRGTGRSWRPNRRPSPAVARSSRTRRGWFSRSPCPTHRRIRPKVSASQDAEARLRELPHRADLPGHLLAGHGRGVERAKPSADTRGRRPERTSLFRTLHDVLEAGDVVLADRHFRWLRSTSRCSPSAAWMRCCAASKASHRLPHGPASGIQHDHLVRLQPQPPRPKAGC